jgi:hypothetical protein
MTMKDGGGTRHARRPIRRRFLCLGALAMIPVSTDLLGISFAHAAPVGGDDAFEFPTMGLRVRDRAVLLAIDDASLPLKRGLCYYLSKPKVRSEPVLMPSRDNPNAPDYLEAFFYGTVLYEGGKFRMWYYPTNVGANPDWPPEIQAQHRPLEGSLYCGPICYAESPDGVHWTKPRLRQMSFKGTFENNAIWLPTLMTACATLIRDEDDPDPGRRYKLCYWYQDSKNYPDIPSFATAVSADGLRWRQLSPRPTSQFIEHGSFYKHNGLYIVNGQSGCGFIRSEGGAQTGRQGIAMVSTDFDHWLGEWADSFRLPEPPNPGDRSMGKSYTQVHLGTGAVSYGNVLVGLYCIWHDDPVFSRISGDFGLVVSNDGLAFREPVKGHVWLSAGESPAPPVSGRRIPTVLTQGNGILNVGETTYIYHGRWRNAGDGKSQPGYQITDRYSEIALATLPRDRWGALGPYPDRSDGSVWSAPFVLPGSGCDVILNAEGARGMRVEIADERFTMLPDYSGKNCGTVTEAGGLDCRVKWPGKDLAALAGKRVRFKACLKKSDGVEPMLYAIYLSACSRRP